MTNLDSQITKLRKGQSLTWEFVENKKELLDIFGGEKSFTWLYSKLTHISLIDTKNKLYI